MGYACSLCILKIYINFLELDSETLFIYSFIFFFLGGGVGGGLQCVLMGAAYIKMSYLVHACEKGVKNFKCLLILLNNSCGSSDVHVPVNE